MREVLGRDKGEHGMEAREGRAQHTWRGRREGGREGGRGGEGGREGGGKGIKPPGSPITVHVYMTM